MGKVKSKDKITGKTKTKNRYEQKINKYKKWICNPERNLIIWDQKENSADSENNFVKIKKKNNQSEHRYSMCSI